jgi:predicted membrane metal-binding protein
MAIVAGLFVGLFGRLLGPRKGALAAVLGIGIYTILVGANAAVVRAAVMVGQWGRSALCCWQIAAMPPPTRPSGSPTSTRSWSC